MSWYRLTGTRWVRASIVSENRHTLLNTVLLDSLEVITLLLLAGDALDTLVVVVLVRGALGGVGAVWEQF